MQSDGGRKEGGEEGEVGVSTPGSRVVKGKGIMFHSTSLLAPSPG